MHGKKGKRDFTMADAGSAKQIFARVFSVLIGCFCRYIFVKIEFTLSLCREKLKLWDTIFKIEGTTKFKP